MDKDISKILESTGLPAELASQLQEAFDNKVKNARLEIEDSVRAEYSEQFKLDKNNLLEAMDNIITDALKVAEKERHDEIKKLAETRERLDAAISENKAIYKKKLEEGLNKAVAVIGSKMETEIKSLRETKKALNQNKVRILSESKEIINQEKAEFAKKLRQIDKFIVEHMTKELSELTQDHKALISTRARLIQENENRFREARDNFIAEAAKKAEVFINAGLKTEMKNLNEDIQAYRENTFGRKMFETFVAEYMSSYFVEGTEVKKVKSMLETAQQELEQTKSQLNEAVSTIDSAKRKAKLAEAEAKRTNTLNKLLGTLSGQTKATMRGLLETVSTEKLEESFHTYLPILTEGKKTEVKTKPISTRTITGDSRRSLTESAEFIQTEAEQDPEIENILKLAGRR